MSNAALEGYDLEAEFGLGFASDYNSQPGGGSFNWYQFPALPCASGYCTPRLGTTLDEYANAATNSAVMYPLNAVYGLFSKYAATQGLDPNKPYPVNAWWQGADLNIEVPKTQVEAVPSGYVQDPCTWCHNGDPSYFDLWSLFGAGHYVVGSFGGQYHEDLFGALNPFHYGDWFIGYITGRGPTMTFTCQVNVGCH